MEMEKERDETTEKGLEFIVDFVREMGGVVGEYVALKKFRENFLGKNGYSFYLSLDLGTSSEFLVVDEEAQKIRLKEKIPSSVTVKKEE